MEATVTSRAPDPPPDSFRKWQAKKQHEAQRIAEAVALCVTHGGAPQPDSISAYRELANGEPSFVNR
jgi:hypothetical protein